MCLKIWTDDFETRRRRATRWFAVGSWWFALVGTLGAVRCLYLQSSAETASTSSGGSPNAPSWWSGMLIFGAVAIVAALAAIPLTKQMLRDRSTRRRDRAHE